MFAETVRQGVRGGYRPALAVQLGSLVGDALWAVLGLVGIGLLLQLDWLRWPIGVRARCICRGLPVMRGGLRAWSSWWPAMPVSRSARRRGPACCSRSPTRRTLPWAALGSAMGAVGVHEPSATDYGIFFAGFMVSSVVWAFVCAAIVDRLFARATASSGPN